MFSISAYPAFERFLTKDETASVVPYVSMVGATQTCADRWATPFGYRYLSPKTFALDTQDIEKRERSFFNPKTGYKVVLLEKGDDVMICFGTIVGFAGELNAQKKIWLLFYGIFQLLGNLFGTFPRVFRENDTFVTNLLQDSYFQGKKVVFIGHSYGGAFATYNAIKHGKRAVTFNSLQIGAALQRRLGEEKLAKAKAVHISGKGDYLTDSSLMHLIFRILSFFRIRIPQNVGKRFLLPSPYANPKKTHDFPTGIVMARLGFHYRALPKEAASLPCSGPGLLEEN